MINLESIYTLEKVFLALSDATRLRILNLLAGQQVCVGHLVEVLKESQPKVSRHLAFLKSAGLVTTIRDGKWVYYQLEEMRPVVRNVVADLVEWFADEDELLEERIHLTRLLEAEPQFRAGMAQEKKPAVTRQPVEQYFEQEERVDEPPLQPINRSQEIDTFLL